MASLGGLRLDVSIPWPLTLVVQDVHLQQYNAIFAVLSQVLQYPVSMQTFFPVPASVQHAVVSFGANSIWPIKRPVLSAGACSHQGLE